jgi:predicted amidohydrolase
MGIETLKVALCQQKVTADIDQNREKTITMVNNAIKLGAKLISLPEMFVCPYDPKIFKKESLGLNDKFIKELASLTKDNGVILVGGSFPEKGEDGKIYNTAPVFIDGALNCTHRKFHLFDINIKDKITFFESKVFGEGKEFTIFDTLYGKMGVAICFDLRFPEMIKKMALMGCEVIIAPAAFNQVTGPLHWELVLRSRAVDSQCFLMATSPALNEELSYHAYGHSAVVDPYGKVQHMLGSDEGMILTDIDLGMVKKVREELPLLTACRLL